MMTIDQLTLEQLKAIHPRATLELMLRLRDAMTMNCYNRDDFSFVDNYLVVSSYTSDYWYMSKQIPNTRYFNLSLKNSNGTYAESPVSFYLPEGKLIVNTFRPGFWFYYLKDAVERTELQKYDYHVQDRHLFCDILKLPKINTRPQKTLQTEDEPQIEIPQLILDPNEII